MRPKLGPSEPPHDPDEFARVLTDLNRSDSEPEALQLPH